MFRASSVSSQRDVFSSVEQFLRPSDQETLNDPNAWYNVFLDQVTNSIDEERFRPLFDEENGRPNAPLRRLVGMLILKEGFGWSDEQLFEAVRFNLLVRRALGLVNLTDEVPVESTYYLFKQRLYRYQLETGSNLVYEVFQELTGDQAKRLGVVGEKLRMDSTLLDSNLATCARLQLILRCLQVFWKSLTDEQKGSLDEADRSLLDQLSAKRASQFVYALEEASKQVWLDGLGGLLLRLYQCYSPESSPRYALIARLPIVPTLQRGNASPDAPASRPMPRRSMTQTTRPTSQITKRHGSGRTDSTLLRCSIRERRLSADGPNSSRIPVQHFQDLLLQRSRIQHRPELVLIVSPFERLQRRLTKGGCKDFIDSIREIRLVEVETPGSASLVDTRNRVDGVSDGDFPGSGGAPLRFLLDHMHQYNLKKALDFLNLILPAHFFHLTDEDQGVGITAVLDVLS